MDHLLSKEKTISENTCQKKLIQMLVYKSYIVLRDLIVSQEKEIFEK